MLFWQKSPNHVSSLLFLFSLTQSWNDLAYSRVSKSILKSYVRLGFLLFWQKSLDPISSLLFLFSLALSWNGLAYNRVSKSILKSCLRSGFCYSDILPHTDINGLAYNRVIKSLLKSYVRLAFCYSYKSHSTLFPLFLFLFSPHNQKMI